MGHVRLLFIECSYRCIQVKNSTQTTMRRRVSKIISDHTRFQNKEINKQVKYMYLGTEMERKEASLL